MRTDRFLRPAQTRTLWSLALLLYLLCTPWAASGQVDGPSLRVVAETPALPYIEAGLNWYSQDRALELSAVPTENLGAKVISVGFTQAADVLLTRYSTFVDFMKTGLFVPLNDIAEDVFRVPEFSQSDLILYRGEVIGVCFGDYDMSFIDRPCLGVFGTSPRKELAAEFIRTVKENEPLDRFTEGELKRIAESFFASLFYVEDYTSAFEFLYHDPGREGEWTREQFVDVMTNRWIYRRVDTHYVLVQLPDVRLVRDWSSPRDGMVFPLVGELYGWAVLAQDPERIIDGVYPLRYLMHWVPDGDEWKVLSAPWNLFE